MALDALASQSARSVRWVRIGRSTATVLTLVAALAMVFAKETHSSMSISPAGMTYSYWSLKSTDNSSFVYFVVGNALACVFLASSFILSFLNKARSSLALVVGDLAATVVLFTSNAAAIAVVMVAWKGTPGFRWSRFCNVAGGFCGPVVAAIVISSISAAVHFLLLSLSIVALHKRSSS